MPQTVYEVMKNNAAKDGFIVYFEHKIPMSRFLEDVERFAAGLESLRLKKGDVVTLYMPSCPQGVVAFYACSKLGLIANIVHPLIPLQLLKQNLQKVQSKVLLFYDVMVRDETEFQNLGQQLVRCSIADYVTFRKPFFALYAKIRCKRAKGIFTYKTLCKQNSPTEICGLPYDTVCYMHSGGTGGQPKIVKLSNEAFNQTALGMKLMYHPDVDGSCYNLATLPIFHAYGLCAAVHAPLTMGASVILVPKFVPKRVKDYLNSYKVTVWSVVPAMLKKLLAANCLDCRGLKNLDVIWCGGDVLDESLVERVDALLHKFGGRAQLMRGYGLTEVCGVCIVNNYDYYKKYSCGKPMPTCKVEVWDENGNALAPNTVGELVVCSGGNMDGYLEGDDCLTKRGEEIWVKTGDLCYLDEEGFVFMVDRKKRSLKIAAVNVFPAQIEMCVKKLNFVDEACAVGVKVGGKQYVKVFVTLKAPQKPSFVQQEVQKICRENLIKYSVPNFVEVLSQMPRTDFGKIDFKKLENM